jgi:hypothetical protein
MKRLAAAATVLLLLSIPGQPASADGATLVWDSDRVISSIFSVEENDTLLIGPGVNISFEPDYSGQPGENDTRPILAVLGRLVVNGTREERVGLSANESLWWGGNEPDCLYIFSGGLADRFSVRNASLSDMVINIGGAGGVFQDCVFERCDLKVASSAVSVVNCTFIFSVIGPGELPGEAGWPSAVTVLNCRFDGRDPASHPPLPYNYSANRTNAIYDRTAILLGQAVSVRDCLISGYVSGIMADTNGSSVQNCTFQDCGFGIFLQGWDQKDTAYIRGCTVLDCYGYGITAYGRANLSDSVVGNCGLLGVYAAGELLMANCTVFNCTTGVRLTFFDHEFVPRWLLTGNRIFGCDGYAVSAEGQDIDLGGNRFDNGTVTNGEGRLQVSQNVRLRVVDTLGSTVPGSCDLAWTDASGARGGQSFPSGSSVNLPEYTIDNDGARADRFPYSLQVRLGPVENRTILAAGQYELTVVLPILPDLVPVHLATDFDSVSALQQIRFLVRVENTGLVIAGDTTVVFLVDGKEVDRQPVPRLAVRGRASVYSAPWRATAGRHTLEARVDSSGALRESNDTNNNLSVQFNVSGSDSPGFSGLYGGWNPAFISLVTVMIIIYVLLVLSVRLRRRRRMERGPEPAPARGLEPFPAKNLEPALPKHLEPAPATIPGATRIKCPKCGKVNEVASPVRPLEVECELCRSRLKLVK